MPIFYASKNMKLICSNIIDGAKGTLKLDDIMVCLMVIIRAIPKQGSDM
jgi:hypothetical protein